VTTALISVVIPAYNAEATVEACLRSIFAQDIAVDLMEVIVIDDCSIDGTASLMEMRPLRPNFRFLRNTSHFGASYSRNAGLREARGVWVTFVDADDELPQNALRTLLRYGESASVDLVVGAHVKKDPLGNAYLNRHGLHSGMSQPTNSLLEYVQLYCHEPYIYTLLVHCWGKLYRRAAVDRAEAWFDTRLQQLEDVNFNFKFLMHTNEICYVDSPVYFHNVGRSSGMSSNSGREPESTRMMEVAYQPVSNFFVERCGRPSREAEKYTGHLVVTTCVVWLQRLWRGAYNRSFQAILSDIDAILSSRTLRDNLRYYTLMDRDSRAIYLSLFVRSKYLTAFSLGLNHLLGKK